MEFWIPKGTNLFHFVGGARFVHGGAMPQEIVVPVVTVKHVRGKSAQETLSARDTTWFGKGSTRAPPSGSGPRPPMSPAEKAAFEELKQSQESGTRLIPKSEKKKQKVRFGKSTTRKPSVIKADSSLPLKGSTTTYQVMNKKRSRPIAVEFASNGKSKR
jgi:hypothetical protein